MTERADDIQWKGHPLHTISGSVHTVECELVTDETKVWSDKILFAISQGEPSLNRRITRLPGLDVSIVPVTDAEMISFTAIVLDSFPGEAISRHLQNMVNELIQ